MNPSGGFLIFLSERVTLWLARAGSVGLAIMMFLTLADVVGRIFDHPVAGTVELTELIMGMIIYLGVGFTTFNRSHIRVDILITMMSARAQAVLDVVTHAIATVFIGFVVWRLFLQAASRVENNDQTIIWEIPVWPVAYVMALASVLMLTSLVLHLVIAARAAVTGQVMVVGDPSSSGVD